MAEAIGVVASVVTIAALAEHTAKFVTTMRNIAKDADHVGKEITRMATQVQMAAASIDIALKQLEGHCYTIKNMQDMASDVLNHIVKHKLADILLKGSRTIKRRMRAVRAKLSSLKRGSKFVKHLKWFLSKKGHVESLIPELQLVEGCLSLVCPILSLEIQLHHSRTFGEEFASRLQSEIHSLKQQLQMQEEKYEIMIRHKSEIEGHQMDLYRAFQKSMAPLLNLSEALRKTESVSGRLSSPTETVIDVDPSGVPEIVITPRPASSSYSGEGRISSRPGSLSSRTSESSSSVSRNQPPQTPSTQLTSPTPSTPPACSISKEKNNPREPLTPPKVSTLRTLEPSGSSKASKKRQELEDNETTRVSEDPELSQKLQAVACTHKMTSKRSVEPNNSQHSDTLIAKIDSRESYNFLSIDTVRSLNIDMVQLDSHDLRCLPLPDKKGMRSILGKVVDVECFLGKRTRPIRMNFWVENSYRSQGFDLILGRRYVNLKRQHDRNSSNTSSDTGTLSFDVMRF